MSETHLVLICTLSAIGLMGSAWFAIFLLVQGKNRIIAEHRKALEAEQRATASRQTFMDNAHHELKTPLQVIDGYLGMLRTTSLTEPQEEMVARATTSTARLTTLIQGLLDLTALADGSYPIHYEWVDLRHLAAETLAAFESTAREKGLRLSMEDELGPTTAWTDGPVIQRILNLLLENALASTETGEIVLRATSHLEGSAMALTLEVDDTGKGLPLGAESALTQPFLDGQKPLSHPGSLGLGLPLATGLAKALGGELTLARLLPGTRARVRLTQPAARPHQGTGREGFGANDLLSDPASMNPESSPEMP